jgi:hypothetical protein
VQQAVISEAEQRRFLETMVRTNRTPAKHYVVARVLLMSDQCQGEPSYTDGQLGIRHQELRKEANEAPVAEMAA